MAITVGLSPSQVLQAYRWAAFQAIGLMVPQIVTVLQADPNRVAVGVGNAGFNNGSFFPIISGIDAVAWTITNAQPLRVWTYHDIGPLVGLSWGYLTLGAGATTYSGFTLSYDPTMVDNSPPPVYDAGLASRLQLDEQQQRQQLEREALNRRTYRDLIRQSMKR